MRLSDRRLLAVLLEEIGIGAARQTLAFHALDKLGRSEYATRKRALQEDGASDDAIGRLEKLPEIRTWADLEESYPAAASAGVYLNRGYIDPGLVFPVMLGVLCGALGGARALPNFKTPRLRLIFAIVVVVMAFEMLYNCITGSI